MRTELREVGEDGLTVHERIVADLAAMYDPLAFLAAEWCPFCPKNGNHSPHGANCVAKRALDVTP